MIEKCFANNEKDAWDIIMEKIEAKQKGTLPAEEDEDNDGLWFEVYYNEWKMDDRYSVFIYCMYVTLSI